MAARGNRDQLVIATKVGMAPAQPGLSPASIRAAAEGSLRRLGIDHIDLYYAHRDDPRTPIDETLSAFGELVGAGKVRYLGASNYSAERLRQARALGARDHAPCFQALQPEYNLLERAEYEGELAALCVSEGIGCVPYYGLASGFLTGKYRRGGGEIDSPRYPRVRDRYLNERGFRAVEALQRIAGAHATSSAAVALAWLAAQPGVVAPIASATSPAQLAEADPGRLAAADGRRARAAQRALNSSAIESASLTGDPFAATVADPRHASNRQCAAGTSWSAALCSGQPDSAGR